MKPATFMKMLKIGFVLNLLIFSGTFVFPVEDANARRGGSGRSFGGGSRKFTGVSYHVGWKINKGGESARTHR